MTEHVRYGNTYNFDVDPPLTADETEQVIEQLQFHLRSLPENEAYVFDLRFGSNNDNQQDWADYVAKSRWIKRATLTRQGKITREVIMDFLRENYAEVLSLPRPGLRRIK